MEKFCICDVKGIMVISFFEDEKTVWAVKRLKGSTWVSDYDMYLIVKECKERGIIDTLGKFVDKKDLDKAIEEKRKELQMQSSKEDESEKID